MSPVKVEILEAQRRRHVGEHDQLECEGGVVRDVGYGYGLGASISATDIAKNIIRMIY